MQAILRLALTSDGGKWIPGAVLGVYDPRRKPESFGPEGQGGFFIIMATTAKYSFKNLRRWRLRKLVNIDAILSSLSKQARIAQKENIRITRTGKLDFHIELEDVTIKPQFDKIVDLDSPGMLMDMPIEFQPKPPRPIKEPVNGRD